MSSKMGGARRATRARDSQDLPRGPPTSPGPLKIIATKPAGDVDRFADRVEAGHGPRRHRLRGETLGCDPASRHLGLGEALAAVGPEPPIGEPALGPAQFVVAEIGKLAPKPDLLR